jgi:hypothetical protein
MRSTELILLISLVTSQVAAAQSEHLPRFEDYPVTNRFRGRVAPVLIESAAYGRMFRTRLREGSHNGPNFAGEFTVVVWGCGTSCQYVAIVDARTGRLSQQTLLTRLESSIGLTAGF